MKKYIIIIFCLTMVNFSFAQSTQLYPDSVVIYNKTTDGTALKILAEHNSTVNVPTVEIISKSPVGKVVSIEKTNLTNYSDVFSVTNKSNYGVGGIFTIKNYVNPNSALASSTLGAGSAFVGINEGTGSAGIFEIKNNDNSSIALSSTTDGLGVAANFSVTNSSNLAKSLRSIHQGLGAAAYFQVLNSNSSANALETQTNGSGASVYSYNNGTGKAGHFQISNGINNQNSIFATSNGTGATIFSTSTGAGSAGHFRNTNTGNGSNVLQSHNEGLGTSGFFSIFNTSNASPVIETRTNGSGRSIYALNEGTGQAGNFEISGLANSSTTLYAKTKGTGRAAEIILENINNNKEALYVSHIGVGTGLKVKHFGVDGFTAHFENSFANNEHTLYTQSNGDGAGIMAVSDGGYAGIFSSVNTVKEAVYMETDGSASVLKVNHIGTEGTNPNFDGDLAIFQDFSTNKIRFDRTGKGFFNGGTQNSGADIAESFAVEGEANNYEPGDVLVISTKTDRTIEKSSVAYSSLVAGVYATKPGVLLTENHIDTDLSAEVPMGVVGVIPTKVCNEGGPIQRGDLLVSSSQIGYAMKADPKKIGFGQVLGKALENFDGEHGKIKVLVNVK